MRSKSGDHFARVHDDFGRIDVLYNDAGLNDPSDHSALDISLKTWQRVFAANLTTVFLCCQRAGAHAGQRPTARIGHQHGLVPGRDGRGQLADGLLSGQGGGPPALRDLGVHLARRGVRVNALLLGPIETPQLQALFAENIGPEEIEQALHLRCPMGRFGTLEELAGTVAYLASDDSGFVTGAAFPLDGGITCAFTVPPSPQPR